MKEFRFKENDRFSDMDRFSMAGRRLSEMFRKNMLDPSFTMKEANRMLERRLHFDIPPIRKPEERPQGEITRIKPPMERLLAKDWPPIREQGSLEKELKACNPNFDKGREWKLNCQRCVPAFEMRRRGYDVTAMPRYPDDRSGLSQSPFAMWKNPEVFRCEGNGLEDICRNMRQWGDGARAEIAVIWKKTNSGHVFCAEQVDGKTRFYDPQTGETDVTKYFKNVEPGTVQICRVDRLDVTENIKKCCRKA